MGKIRGADGRGNVKLAHRFGVQAERAAALYLKAKGYRILKPPATRCGPVKMDIIAQKRRDDRVHRGQAPAKASLKTPSPRFSPRQRDRIIRAAECWLAENDLPLSTDCRFDMIVFSATISCRTT